MIIAFWNIRGICDSLRQAEIRTFIRSNRLHCFGILETKALSSHFDSISPTLASGWKWTSNYDSEERGRIWFGWNPTLVDFDLLTSHLQYIHGRIRCIASNKTFCISVVYGLHFFVDRRPLWAHIVSTSAAMVSSPWIVAGDFNAVRFPADRQGTTSEWLPGHDELGRCIEEAGLEDLRYIGHHYTWSSSSGESRVLTKIDRVLVNEAWCSAFSFSEANFLPSGISDHSPALVKVFPPIHAKKPFKFFNLWMKHPSFLGMVERIWSVPIAGSHMYSLCSRLKLLKEDLKLLNKEVFSDISRRTSLAREDLNSVQEALNLDPFNHVLANEEATKLAKFWELRLQEEMFFKQKSRVRWLKEGDKNTKFFHSAVNQHHLRNRIISIVDDNGNVISDRAQVQNSFVNHFKDLLASSTNQLPALEDISLLVDDALTDDQVNALLLPITDNEVRDTLFSLASNKAPGPDGYNVDFFKFSWRVVGPSVIAAVKEFFHSGKLLREFNNTIIALVPKKPNSSTVHDFRPISCCNTIYKCIAKLLARRMAPLLPSIISPAQTAFVKGRRISDNILLTQELFAGFHLQTYSPKCVLKVDFRKAYDTVDWSFLRRVLLAFKFPPPFVNLIMECVSTPKFSVSLNGELHGFFGSGRGIRQGDPLSSYLFTLIMQVFSCILQRDTNSQAFKYFWRCKNTRLTHLFFADDVLLFAEADTPSLLILQGSISLFSSWSGLSPNPTKSEAFFSGIASNTTLELLDIFGFQLGTFPVKYLGVPLISKRLSKEDCTCLVNAITSRIRSWIHRFLSQAGCLQLVKSVLYSIHVYWAQVFSLPSSVLNNIEKIMRQFLWKGPNLGQGGAKVSWADICCPKDEGGLGIRRLRDWNKAAILKHIWILFTDKESLWCKWIHSTFLKNSNFWIASTPTFRSWAWRKILDIREVSLPLFRWRIGRGNISFWFDSWHPRGPLHKLFTERDRTQSGFPIDAKVRDFLTSSRRHSRVLSVISSWPDHLPTLSDTDDEFEWIHTPGPFTTSGAWDAIRNHKPHVLWSSLIWDTTLPPRNQFHLWLIMKKRLPTQIYLMSYGRLANATCAFCALRPDSIDHLFFNCTFSRALIIFWAAKCNLFLRNDSWDDNIAWAIRALSGGSFHKTISRFSFAAVCYIIWKERNNILFRGKVFRLPILKKHLIKVVRDMALLFKGVPDSPINRRLQRSWNLPASIFSTADS